MTGMGTKLHLIADRTGEFSGSAAEISGKGFSGMKFKVKATTQEDFDRWVETIKQSKDTLDFNTYKKLAEPSENNPTKTYSGVEKNLYNSIIMNYMMPKVTGEKSEMHMMNDMEY